MNMNVGVIGTGRTGGLVLQALEGHAITGYNQTNPPTLEALRTHDVLVVFLPGPAFLSQLDMLVESGIPVVTGSTGFAWPEDIATRLQAQSVAWITAANFSLGMNLVYGMIKVLGKAPKLFDEYKYALHEIHHIHKKDHPSGTALSWEKWLAQPVEMTSDREGDNPGDHKLTLVTPFEDISIQHQAKDRRIFAEGAAWTAQRLARGDLEPGLHQLTTIMEKELSL
jgi:4-hydroxy-tetrahydrodipicolinate reductase